MYRAFAAILMIWFIASRRKSIRMWTWMGRYPAMAMPIATPVMASSDSGVSKQRAGPNFLCRPMVVP